MRLAALLALALSLVAAGCGARRTHVITSAVAAPSGRSPVRPCVLSARQKRAVAVTRREIRRLHRLEAPLTRWSENGTPAMQAETGRILDDLGKVQLPIDTRARLLRLARAASGLCGLCFGALEAEEPVLATGMGRNACTGR